MYIVQNSFKNLLRHKKRYITTGILLLVAFSVLVCAIFHYRTFDGMIKGYENELLSSCCIRFREELHFLGSSARTYHYIFNDTRDEDGIIWFDSEAMAAYNHPYPFTREMFYAVAQAEEVESHELLYIETGYRTIPTPEELRSMGATRKNGIVEHYIVGGDPDTFMMFNNNGLPHYIYETSLVSGAEPEDGECLISEYYAEKYGLSIGDTLILYDDSLSDITAELTVSGMMRFFRIKWPYTKYDAAEIDDLGIQEGGGSPSFGGTPFDRIGAYELAVREQSDDLASLRSSFLNVIFTTFDTAYYLHGDETADPDFAERHHFNKYFVSYKLKEGADAEEFAETAVSILSEYTPYAEEFTTAGAFTGMCSKLTDAVSYHWKSAQTCISVGMGMAGIILLLALITNVRERKREIGILYSLGGSKSKIGMLFGMESAMLSGIVGIAAQAGAYFMHLFTVFDSNYIRKLELSYQLTGWGIAVIPMAVAAAFVVGWAYTAAYLRVKTPAVFVKAE